MFSRLCHLSTIVLLSLSAVIAARYPSFGTIQTTKSAGVLNAVINNTFSQINLFDQHVMADLGNLIEELQANDTDVRVVVFSSGNKDFFFPHIDSNSLLPGYESPLPQFDPGNPKLAFPVALLWNITQLPQATIAVIEGRVRGIGNEFIMSCDMRFASTSPSVQFAQIETSLGRTTGAGGAMYLAHEIGRSRAFEYVLSSKNADAVTAAQIGWINQAFDNSTELHDYVQKLAARIALFPSQGIIATKKGINAVSRPPIDAIIQLAQNAYAELTQTPIGRNLTNKWLQVTNNQSLSAVELNYGDGEDIIELLP
ncbi:ClpP/crotonase-like domain-containing protein [Mycena metata]|uniref:ClpP/crotonase-like domain-containing protein n=1 Tax=Mycena metata TaxID=1033252 RepID=A0AAD7JXJ9_9AGAR|nr:ClpP/crotonase-like domain-containing protein [Mycena metata]